MRTILVMTTQELREYLSANAQDVLKTSTILTEPCRARRTLQPRSDLASPEARPEDADHDSGEGEGEATS